MSKSVSTAPARARGVRTKCSVQVIKAIVRAAAELLGQCPGGLSRKELSAGLEARFPSVTRATIYRIISDLLNRDPEVFRPWAGQYALRGVFDEASFAANGGMPVTEEQFYEAFAAHLSELEGCECTPLGGGAPGGLWNTPDVIGRIAAKRPVPFPYGDKLLAGELKTSRANPILAFGQACAYRLFAHLVYVAVPCHITPDERARMVRLCRMFSLGLVLFDDRRPDDPRFTTLLMAGQGRPDMALLNEKAEQLKIELFG